MSTGQQQERILGSANALTAEKLPCLYETRVNSSPKFSCVLWLTESSQVAALQLHVESPQLDRCSDQGPRAQSAPLLHAQLTPALLLPAPTPLCRPCRTSVVDNVSELTFARGGIVMGAEHMP